MDLHRNSMEFYMHIFYEEISTEFFFREIDLYLSDAATH
jgi:hypothetical protein